MTLAKIIFYFVIVWVFNFKVEANENQQKCVFELHKSVPMSAVRNVELKIDTKLKQEIINSRELLSNLIKKEFELQRKEFIVQQEKFIELVKTVESQKEELKLVQRELSDQRNFIKIQLAEQSRKIDENVKNQLDTICGKQFVTQNQKLVEDINKTFLNQGKFQERLVDHAIQAAQLPQYDSNRWNTSFHCIRNCDPIADLPDNCGDAMKSNFSQNGVYLLNIPESELSPFFAYCKRIDGKVWTIIQRREDGSVDFYQNWQSYKNGFGNLHGELWMGLERLHVMTSKHKHELNVWLENKSGKKVYAHYDEFSIASEAEKYKLFVKGYTGDAGNDLSVSDEKYRSNGTKFSTHDKCNDNHDEGFQECSQQYRGAWWFSKCYMSHLNGPYNSSTKDGVDWNNFGKKLKFVQMGIRTKI